MTKYECTACGDEFQIFADYLDHVREEHHVNHPSDMETNE